MSVLIHPRDLQFILFELLDVEKLCQSTATRIVTRPCLKQPLRRHTGLPWSSLNPLPKFVMRQSRAWKKVARFCRMVLPTS